MRDAKGGSKTPNESEAMSITITETRVYTTNEQQVSDSYVALSAGGHGTSVCDIVGPVTVAEDGLLAVDGELWAIRDVITKAAANESGLSLCNINAHSATANQRNL